MTKFYNNVKSRLNKKGINGFTKADYLEAVEQLKIDDLDNVTTEQILAGVELLENRRNSQITAVNTVNNNVNTSEPTDAIAPLSDSPIVHREEPETLTQQEEVSAIAPLEENNYEDAIAPTGSSELAVSNADKQSLVATQSLALGIELSEQETEVIADSIDDTFYDYSSFLSSVTSAIKGYIAHKFDSLESQLDSNTNDVQDYLAERNFRINQKLADYANSVKSIKADTQQIRQNLKVSEKAILSRFRTTR
jgi:hypothetical protein